MQFGSKQKRNLVTGSILALVPDIVIAIIAASWTDSGVFGFFVTLIGLQVLYLLIWAKNAVWGWFLFWVRGRRNMTEHLLDYLRSNSFPEPREYQDNVESYFQEVMADETLPTDLRIKAAIELRSFAAIRLCNRGSLLMQTFLSYEDALQKYKRTFPAEVYA